MGSPSMECTLANHLTPSLALRLPSWRTNRTASLLASGRDLIDPWPKLLMAYLGSEMDTALTEGKPIDAPWADIRTASDLILRTSRCMAQASGRAMSLAVVGLRHTWLNIPSMNDRIKWRSWKHPIANSSLFVSAAIEAIQRQYKVLRKQQPAFKAVVPSRQVTYTRPAPNFRRRTSHSAPSSPQWFNPSTSNDCKDAPPRVSGLEPGRCDM